MEQNLRSISKYLSLVLRHRPEAIGLVLDKHGWVEISQLLELSRRSGKTIPLELLRQVVRENDKQRFSISDDGSRIRANQGHSIEVDLQLRSVEPPVELFHGTVERFIESIRRQGLLPRKRNHVHLSRDSETARIVGQDEERQSS